MIAAFVKSSNTPIMKILIRVVLLVAVLGFCESATNSSIEDRALTWPIGTYGLMETVYGCPSGFFLGKRYHDTEDKNNANAFSRDIQQTMRGLFGRNIETYFCMKTADSYTIFDKNWGKGAYCILKYGVCPQGFGDGYVYWDDEDTNNKNGASGYLPEGQYDRNTRIDFCCRNDGPTYTPLYLPTDQPFILIRYGSSCQSVYGMMVQTLFIKWDDEDTGNKDSVNGMHPADSSDPRNHKIFYCYYYSQL